MKCPLVAMLVALLVPAAPAASAALTPREAQRAVRAVLTQRFDVLATEGHTTHIRVDTCRTHGMRGLCHAVTKGAETCKMRAHVHERARYYEVWVDRLRCLPRHD